MMGAVAEKIPSSPVVEQRLVATPGSENEVNMDGDSVSSLEGDDIESLDEDLAEGVIWTRHVNPAGNDHLSRYGKSFVLKQLL